MSNKTQLRLETELREAQARIAELEQALREAQHTSEPRFATIFETSPVAIGISNVVDGKITDVNAAFLDFYGFTREQVIGRTTVELGIWVSIEDRQQFIEQLLTGNSVRNIEVFTRLKSGDERYVLVSGRKVEIHGESYLVAQVQDITARKQAELRRDQLTERLDLATRSARMGIWDWNIQKNEIIWDDQMYTLYGLEPGEFGGAYEAWLNGVHPDDRESSNEVVQAAVRGEREFDTEFRVLWPDGSVHWLKANGQLSRDANGNPVRMVGVNYDITERKHANEALKESERRFSTAFFTSPVAQSIIDAQRSEILAVNDACCHLFGYDHDELIGASTAQLNLWANPAERLSAVQELQSTGHLLPRETSIRKKSGELHTVLAAIEPIAWKGIPCLISFVIDINERKLAEEKLRESEELLRLAHEATDVGVWKNDLVTGEVYFDERSRLHYGFDRNRVTLADVANRIHPADARRVSAEIAAAISPMGSGKFATEYRVIHTDGSIHWLSIGVRVTFEGHGDQRHSVMGYGTSIDITDRKQAEQSLKDGEARIKNMIDSAMDAIVTANQDMCIVLFNSAAERMFGVSSEEALGQPIDRFMPKRFHASHHEQMLMLSENPHNIPTNRIFSITGLRANGEEFPAESTFSYVENNGEKLFTAILRDVADRRQAEVALRESNARFRQIAESIQEVFWMYDEQQERLLYVSPGFEMVWGRSSQVVFDNNQQYLEYIFPEDLPLMLDVAQHQERGEPTELEYRIVRPDGSIRWIYERSFPVLDENGTLARTTGIATDITNRKLIEQESIYRQELLEKVIQLGKKITALTDLDKCLYEIYQSARFGLGFDRIGLFLYDESLRHVLGVYGTSRAGEIEEPGFFDGYIEHFGGWEKTLASPNGVYWLKEYQKEYHRPEGHPMHGVRHHVTVAAWAGKKPVALIAADNLLTDRDMQPAQIEALQLFAGYAGLAIENATLHTELEMKVEERTAEVQDLYNNAPAGYHSLDARGNFIQINQTELTWLGYTQNEVLGHHISEFITEKSQKAVQENFPLFLQGRRLRDLELEMVRKDGSTFPALVNATAVMDERGNFVMSRTTVFDNTERKHAEDALRQSEETYRALFENANDGIYIFGLDTCIRRVNPAGAEMLGYSIEELIGKAGDDFLEAEQADSHQRAQRMSAGERIPTYEQKLLRKDGSRVEVEINLSLVRDTSGKPQFIQSVVRDVSTRKHAEETLRLANIELERALRLKDEFLASMSHELRTPLTGILGLSEALQYDTYGELSPKQKNIIANIESNGHHLLDLINDILDISKMEAGKLELEMVACSLDAICQSSIQLVKGMAQKKGQYITFSMNPTGIVVNGDTRRLKQIVVNLLSNAVKYSPEKSPIGLDVTADHSSQHVRIDVWDKGMGIASEDLNRLFQPFVQLDSSLSRSQSGTGLGLALVQRLAALHGGSIQVESTIGEGSRFTVMLPYLPNESGQKAEETTVTPHQIQRSLIVDDSAVDANRLARFLKILGIHTLVETRGDGVVEKALASQPSVILLDINLPDVSGWDVLEQLKQNEKTRAIPVVITSVVEERERANELGAAGYLLKFFTLDDLRLILLRIPKPESTHDDKALVVSPNVHPGVVMIVDDNETNVLMLADFLESRNYKAFSASSGFDFLARVGGMRPDVVLMDIQMPDMDGLETIRRLRALPDPEVASTPVIAITALAMPGDRERCLAVGANEYLSKPIRLRELATMIQDLLLDQDDTRG